ncbi:ATP phosphoribosyltransferase 2, chloroplastic-like [Olea europaea subsp. europaea]|uniref:ATP phosphoribosyltransferase 2, chloroplastic-like n=1 Tax=Olea europaea subsp. europaea TaxID=158383 RepID=A0A8S0VC35_OLEEU|nr:ATP phosphoribosyltransferase 2, chloroplastic-like [Olea europaea subsp. europaea]
MTAAAIGTTLRENNLKEMEGGVILESQVFAIPADTAKQAKCLLDISNEILEGLEAHLRAVGTCQRGEAVQRAHCKSSF